MSSPQLPHLRFISGRAEASAALATLFVVGAVYLRTIAPTLTFWDAGEFIACSHILGIPHPPGTPFFILLGRFATLALSFHPEVAWRVNMLSAVSSIAAAVLGCLIVFRVVRPWLERMGHRSADLVASAAAMSGSSALAFGSTFWANGTESEVYGTSMLFLMLITWLAVVWYHAAGSRGADRLLILTFYLVYLGIGVHMQNLMLVVPVFLMVAIRDRRKLADPLLWTVAVVGCLALVHTTGFLVAGTLGLVALAAVQTLARKEIRFRLALPLALFTVMAVGYSPHIYIPVRSMLDPAIDENDPETWESFKGFLERKQYGSESMLTRAMTRRGTWKSQLISNQKMGLWHTFSEQWSSERSAVLIFTFAGALGLLVLYRRSVGLGSLIGLAMIVGSIGLVFYLNLSDGTLGAKEEVRNRDYFFAPGFVYFSLLFGVGVAAFLDFLHRWVRETPWSAGLAAAVLSVPYLVPLATEGLGWWQSLSLGALIVALLMLLIGAAASLLPRGLRPTAVTLGSAALFLAFSAQQPLYANFHTHDRSRDRIANDYGYNILHSCEEGGLIFTNGDNDTFPLWYLQEVEEFRKDVRVLNLSLLNTNWYIKQLRDREPRVSIALSDEEVEAIPPYVVTKGNRVVRKQDRMIEHIITQNRWRQPIYFAITVPEQNRLGLDKHLQMEGFVYRLHPTPVDAGVHAERTRRLLEEYRYDGLADPTIFKDDNTLNLLNNYVAIIYQLAIQYKDAGDLQSAAEILELGLTEVRTKRWEVPGQLAQLYVRLGRDDDANRVAKTILEDYGESTDAIAYVGRVFLSGGLTDAAIEVYERALERWPESDVLYQALFYAFYQGGRQKAARETLDDWLAAIPGSSNAAQIMRQMSALDRAPEEKEVAGGGS